MNRNGVHAHYRLLATIGTVEFQRYKFLPLSLRELEMVLNMSAAVFIRIGTQYTRTHLLPLCARENVDDCPFDRTILVFISFLFLRLIHSAGFQVNIYIYTYMIALSVIDLVVKKKSFKSRFG